MLRGRGTHAPPVRQGRELQPDREHQGPDGAAYRAPGPRVRRAAGGRDDRRGDERQHRHLVLRGRARAGTPGDDLHARLDERRTDLVQAGGMIVEATSGNTGISFCAVGRALGHPVTIFMPDWMSAERISLIRSFGATVKLVTSAEGGFLGSIKLAEELAANTPGAFLPRQFSNEANSDAHFRSTGPELWAQLQSEH